MPRKKPPYQAKSPNTEITVAKLGIIAAILTALITVIGMTISGYFNYLGARTQVELPIQATQTSAKLTLNMELTRTALEANATQGGATPIVPVVISETQIPTVTAKNTPVQNLAVLTLTPGDPSVLFHSDFENGKDPNKIYIEGDWKIVTDELGNKVYDMDNSTGTGSPFISFGSDMWKDYRLWKDYEIKFRTRILGDTGSQVVVNFRNDGTNTFMYVVSMELASTSLYYTAHDNNGWQTITNRKYSFKKDIWHWVRIEAKGTEIKISIDDSIVINTNDARYNTGGVNIKTGQYTHAQFDDIQIMSLEK